MAKVTIDKALWHKYCELFCQGLPSDEKKGEENRLKYLLGRLNDPDGVYQNFPLTALDTEEQAKVLYYLLNGANERQIISNMGKNDVDRDYFNFIYEKSNSENISSLIMEDFPGYVPYNFKQEKNASRRIIRDSSIPGHIMLVK